MDPSRQLEHTPELRLRRNQAAVVNSEPTGRGTNNAKFINRKLRLHIERKDLLLGVDGDDHVAIEEHERFIKETRRVQLDCAIKADFKLRCAGKNGKGLGTTLPDCARLISPGTDDEVDRDQRIGACRRH